MPSQTMQSATSSSARIPFARRAGPLDAMLAEADRALRVLAGAASASRTYPAGPEAAESLTPTEKRQAAGLMRVNHVGEICAQALYRGQAAACADPTARALLKDAAAEEVDHLAWCQRRLTELNSRPSLLNPLWYAGSFGLGLVAGRAGVARNLGFMAETERQVEAHLDGHLKRLPAQDTRSRNVVEQMKQDEIEHRVSAERAGAATLPWPVRSAMRLLSRVMTSTSYWI
jgi:ubiquinone biosynthesis monooxygenase Coq7